MKKIWPDAPLWLKRSNVQQSSYHGGTLQGNSCKRLLEKLDILESMCPLECLPFLAALKAFKEVVASCFGLTLKPDYIEEIRSFRSRYLDLEINVTPKVHAVFFHITEFCEKHGVGLGIYSEQASESVHAHFKKIW